MKRYPGLGRHAPLVNQSGDFGNAAGGLTEAGASPMALNATNTYTGATTTEALETGAFSGAAPGDFAFQFNAAGTELDLVPVPVPEPATWFGGLLLVEMAVVSRRHKINSRRYLARSKLRTNHALAPRPPIYISQG